MEVPDIDLDPGQLQRSPEFALLDALFTVAQQAHEKALELGEVLVHHAWSLQQVIADPKGSQGIPRGCPGVCQPGQKWGTTYHHSSFVIHHLSFLIPHSSIITNH